MATHPMAGGNHCAVIGGAVTFKGSAREARRLVKAARRSGDRTNTFVGLSASRAVGDAWTL